MLLKTLKCCLFLIFFISAVAQQSDNFKNSSTTIENIANPTLSEFSEEQKKLPLLNSDVTNFCKELFTDLAQIGFLEFFISSLATIIHESGHAVATNLLFEIHDPIEIHIGTRQKEKFPKLFSLGNMHFYKRFPWKCGFVNCDGAGIKKARENYANMDLGIKSIAGGVSASILMYFLLSAITGYCAYCDHKGLIEITLKSFINGCNPFSYILDTKNLSCKQKRILLNATLVICLCLIDQFFYGCTPSRSGDGMRLWKENIGLKGLSLDIAKDLSRLGEFGCWIMLIKKYCDARKQLSHEIVPVSIYVALTSLFLICCPTNIIFW